jgi:hypothetical protein
MSFAQLIWSIAMIEQKVSGTIGRIKGFDESTRDTIAIGIWIVVFVGLVFLNAHGQSKLETAGLIFQLTGAYSTFLLCAKRKYGPFIHGVPYVFALTGAMLLCLAPNLHNSIAASLVFLAVTAMMHGTIIHDMRKDSAYTGKTTFMSECVT